MVSERALRKVSACALPRPSAMASAKFAKRTVNQSHNVICRLKSDDVCGLRTSNTVVIGECVPRWWQHGLHNHRALQMKARLLFEPGVAVVSVPHHV